MIDKNSGEVLETARRRSVTKEVVPDVRALLFWLKNRRPDKWRDKPEIPGDTDALKKARELLEGIPSAID